MIIPTNDRNAKKLRADLSNRENMRLKYLIFEKKHSIICLSLYMPIVINWI